MRFGRLTAVAAATAALALVTAPAFAAVTSPGPVDVDVIGTDDPIIAVADKGDTVLSANGHALTCTGSQLAIHAVDGTGLDPAATITDASWSTCNFSGIPADVSVDIPNCGNGDWALTADQDDVTSALTDVVDGVLANIHCVEVVIHVPLFGDCTFNVDGSVNGYLDEDNGKGGQELAVDSSNLTVSNVAGACLGQVNNNDPATFSGHYNTDGNTLINLY
jgi:hypothetical protein